MSEDRSGNADVEENVWNYDLKQLKCNVKNKHRSK
jgi:hypothetical protein